jgi:hypothetical protein
MEILVTENDYNEALGTAEVRNLRQVQKEAILGNNAQPGNQAILDALPRVLAERFKKMIPPDYEVQQIELKVQIAGQPFGVGIRGDATVKFGPRAGKTG